MSFFLLGRSGDDVLTLLSDAAFESRQDALAELGRITADPTFDRWDDDVLLLDLDSGTPVLLVRPTAPAAEAVEPVPEPEAAPEAAAFAVIADDVPVEVDVVAEAQPETDEIPVPGVEAEPEEVVEPEAVAPAADDVVEPEVELVTEEMPEAEGEIEAVADEVPSEVGVFVERAASADSEAVEEPAEIAGIDALRDAIARTTEHMESTGIVAPESVGSAEPQARPEAESDIPDSILDVENVDSVVADLLSDVATAETRSISEAAIALVPASPVVESQEEDLAAEVEPAEEPSEPGLPEPAPPAWPWDTSSDQPEPAAAAGGAVEPEVGFVLDGLEEPSLDDGGSLIVGLLDDDALAANRPVILGAYGDEEAAETEGETTVTDDESALQGPEESESDKTAADEIVVPDGESDFIVLDDVSPSDRDVSESSEATKTADDSPDGKGALSDYTCKDCVYVETCPNKDQRRPEDCGSFQWK
jgi:hypothetical protein